MKKEEVNEFEINGCVVTPSYITHDEFYNEFIMWIDSKGWQFGGSTKEYVHQEENNTIS